MPETKSRSADKRSTARTFTPEERAAMREHAQELKARRDGRSDGGEQDVLRKIAEMHPADRRLAESLHRLVRTHAPGLGSRTWYGMPAYTKGGQVLCFFQPAGKFKTRYATVGFSDEAALDDGRMWPTVFALTEMTPVEEARLVTLLQRAIG